MPVVPTEKLREQRKLIREFREFVDRGNVRRVISLRRANRREVRRYVQVFEQDADPDA